ncbi:hypothetical protein Glove_553g22 [Diversispora epigaea]|uniref:Uncharacterized protein n=1 Tax=Diversispora epigaea TaxID=1348612 RepID=A0A397GB87_9GLOM|nr:hypothetical protein Glove_553g22 [Diversispora epigaea]
MYERLSREMEALGSDMDHIYSGLKAIKFELRDRKARCKCGLCDSSDSCLNSSNAQFYQQMSIKKHPYPKKERDSGYVKENKLLCKTSYMKKKRSLILGSSFRPRLSPHYRMMLEARISFHEYGVAPFLTITNFVTALIN